ncbi:MAG TPA: N-(5'-phosphoribosyl)anthranilate isomerase [Cytophagales bacterium]|nr:N-(5'-phosphoribosyl)anthranilate isomerase [Cytophagales bacterium]
MKLKICGMRDPENIREIASLNPDFMGFIFFERSKRFVGNEFSIPKAFPENVKRVGVFVNESLENIFDKVIVHQLDYVQLHGDENPAMCLAIRDKVKVIKVFRVDDRFGFELTSQFSSCADYFLFDTKSEVYGGSGKTFEWNILKEYKGNIPFFLSGGLSLENILSVKKLNHPMLFALDMNSGVELASGLKNADAIKSVQEIMLNEL